MLNKHSQAAPASSKPDTKAGKTPRPPNPVWRMMGLPNMRLRLPSRNWMIFLSITGSFTAAVVYDKREKRRAQRKWCKLVENLALEPLDSRSMPRRLTVYLEGPPTDSLRIAQDHFKEYVKPILVSSGLDWEFVQGRKEGDIRAALAERIRKFRTPIEEAIEDDDPTTRIRRQNGIQEFDGPAGDIVVGRHTWKEYVRGLHEGWLGPLKDPVQEPENTVTESPSTVALEVEQANDSSPGTTIHSSPADSDSSVPADTSPPDTPTEKPKKPPQPQPFISVTEYEGASIPPKLPTSFDPSVPISFPHILGFANTPTRLYRFLNRRHLADTVGRETAAIVLSNSRPYHTTPTAPSSSFPPSADESSGIVASDPATSEQAIALAEEQKDWHKSVRKHVENERERTWINDMVLDPRIAGRMRRAVLSPEDEERAAKIVVAEEEIEGWIKGSLRGLWRSGKAYAGFGPSKAKPEQESEEEDLN
jgi:mitochondrial import inner membrane translocase subunit TIM54